MATVGLGVLPALCPLGDVAAAPAAYWRWRSGLDGQEFCAQTSPGRGWTQVAGPYRDLHCREPGSVPLRRWSQSPPRTP